MKNKQKLRIKELLADRKYYLDLIHAGEILKSKKTSQEAQEQQRVFLKELASLEMLLTIEILDLHADNPNFNLLNIQSWEDFQKLMKKLDE